MKYLPKPVIEELEIVKKVTGVGKDCQAFNELVNYSRIGREAEKIMTFGLPGFRRRR